MAKCPHCGESLTEGQENCYACGQHVRRRRAYQHEHHVNPLVYVGAGLIVVVVLGGLWWIRANAAAKQAALVAEEEALQAQDSVRRASHDWLDALRAAQNDDESRSYAAALEDVESRFESVRTRVAAHPTPHQDSIISEVETGLEQLRRSAVILATRTEERRQTLRDSIEAGRQRLEDLTRELGSGQ